MAVEPPSVLELEDITKAFPGVIALRGVSFVGNQSEVHALVGENGAGKSTLVKIIAGAVAPDSGAMRVSGRTLAAYTPRHAMASGIAVLHQERQIGESLSVSENVLLGRLPTTRLGMVRWREAERQAQRILRSLGVDIDLSARVRDLSAAEWQLIEAARAMSRGARVVVMDEPTSSLGGKDAKHLFTAVKRLRANGACVVYVSHQLEEVLELADRISVLRDGRLIATVQPHTIDKHKLAELIIGRSLPDNARLQRPRRETSSEVAIDLKGVVVSPVLGPISLTVPCGQVTCVAGAVGSGRRELARIAACADRPDSGGVAVFGRPVRSIRAAVRSGLAFVPDDRKRNGLLSRLSALHNIALGGLVLSTSPLFSPAMARRRAAATAQQVRFDSGRLDSMVELLSGGTQQKVLIGRWMIAGVRAYVLDEPTAGVDVGARSEIYRILRERVAEGLAVLCFSSDFDEIREIADRVLVLRDGQWAGELQAGEITAEALYAMQLGLN